MAFKGITWAGNIYQKFETMCLEVEEVMYEDTVKYMENQVQKVGASVKKFYSEVMHDLHPPSCVDPIKSPGNLSLNPYPDTDIKKKPKLSVFDGQREVKKKDTEDEVVSDRATGTESCYNVHNKVNNLSLQHSNVLVENTDPKSCSTKSRMGIHRRAVGIKRISQNSRPAKVSSAVTSSSGYGSSKLTHDMNKASEVDAVRLSGEAINNKALTYDDSLESSSDIRISAESVNPKKQDSNCALPACDIILSADESHSQKKDNSACTSFVKLETENSNYTSPVSNEFYSAKYVRQMMDNLECTSPDSDEIKNAESARQKKNVSGCTSSCGSLPLECASMSRDSFSKLGLTFRSNNACEVESAPEEFMTPNEGSSMTDGSFHLLSSNSDICNVEFGDDFDMEVIEYDRIDEPRLEILDPIERSKLEETCVFVEGDDELHLAQCQGIKKYKSYKKKICKALFSKSRLQQKQDQPVPESKDPGEKNNSGVVMMMDSKKGKLQGHESLESDWELL